ncbi:hypothetical protein QCA50_002429 [Cerrena zonata]|uniref:Homeobox domain-containing protein n=1 Tax=Cerrena zonata TaxID=2478898 RepID=A0AAW0GVI5_9APHY
MFPTPLSRTSSASSLSSENSMDDERHHQFPSACTSDGGGKRTRKRFSGAQLVMLEDLFHTCSHPTREQRESLARKAGLELRSVTVWFQNKRQTERKVALGNATNVHDLTSGPSTSRVIQRTVSAKTQPRLSRNSPSASSITSLRDHHRPRLAEHRRVSLDSVATRNERPQLNWQPQTPTRTRTYSFPDLSNSSRTLKPSTPSRQLWEKMPSSPASPDSPTRDKGVELVYLGLGARTKSKRTLEWACAAARRNHKKEDEDMDVSMTSSSQEDPQLAKAFRFGGREAEDPVDDMMLDFGGDTEDETEAHEAITPMSTPSSSQVMKKSRAPEEGVSDGGEKMDIVETEKDGDHDEEMVKAALALCGLSASWQ